MLLTFSLIISGAIDGTVTDIWRMIWSENITTIVMLTNLVELGKVIHVILSQIVQLYKGTFHILVVPLPLQEYAYISKQYVFKDKM